VSCWGLKPADVRWATAPGRDRCPVGQGVDTHPARQVVVDRVDATPDRGSRARRGPPPARRTARSAPRREPPGGRHDAPGQQLTQGSGPSKRNSKCCVRLLMVGNTFWGSVVASTRRRGPAVPRGLEQCVGGRVDSMWTRRRCRPSGGRVCRGPAGTPGPAWRPPRCWRRHRVRAHRVTSPGDLHAGTHTPQGSPSRRSVQLSALARIRAVESCPSAGSTEQIGMSHPLVAHGICGGQHHVVLTSDLAEGGRAEPPIQRLVGGVVR